MFGFVIKKKKKIKTGQSFLFLWKHLVSYAWSFSGTILGPEPALFPLGDPAFCQTLLLYPILIHSNTKAFYAIGTLDRVL